MKKTDLSALSKKQKTIISCGLILSAAVCILSFCLWARSFKNPANVKPLTEEQALSLNAVLDQTYPLNRGNDLKPLPYPIVQAQLDVQSGSAILIDTSNGCVLFEKNADEVIPPASITKLFVMYIVFKEVQEGNLSLDELVQPPESSWAINMPPSSSLMFLGQGHKVTVRELLKGLAVASGNDAAIAVANKVSGSTKAFVERMNYEAKALGLTNTYFVEPSGYSEKNLTTARELAKFCRIYINTFPQSLSDFHSLTEIRYPLKENLPSWQQSKGDTMAVYQKNTNPLLGILEGCDGLKTGFIFESGYNLALTCQRQGVRYLSVTMKGPGKGSKQGNYYRRQDGTTMMEWAFSSFADYDPAKHISQSYTVPTPGSKTKFINLVPAWNSTVTVPHLKAQTALEDAQNVVAEVQIPRYIYGGTECGKIWGQIQYKLGDTVLETVPLVADRQSLKSGLWGRFWGALASFTLRA